MPEKKSTAIEAVGATADESKGENYERHLEK
jgi:hypothetical protein